MTGPPAGCRRPAVHAGLDPYPSVGDPGEDLLGGGGGRGIEQPLIGSLSGEARQSPDEFLGFFRDCRGREMAAGVQAAGIIDDRKTERAYLNMEARCPASEIRDLQKRRCFIKSLRGEEAFSRIDSPTKNPDGPRNWASYSTLGR